ncbi:hypothetical protein GmHk_18G052195 [Glycine max]|nr:hypothetical protein GmHk_18G052195 [Glycine max]
MQRVAISDDDDDDNNYIVSNSFAKKTSEEEDVVDGQIQRPPWNDASHYSYINWSHVDHEDILGEDVHNSWNIGDELNKGLEFETKEELKNSLFQYSLKIHQKYFIVELKSKKYIFICPNMEDVAVTQWGGQHTCLNPTLAQDHSKLTLDTIANNIKGVVDKDPSLKIVKAIVCIFGDWDESYTSLPGFMKFVQAFSPYFYYYICNDEIVTTKKI